MYQNIVDVFPEINWIEDTALRQKVMDTYQDGIDYGKWKLDVLANMPYTVSYVTPVTFRDHVRGVTALAVEIYEQHRRIYMKPLTLNRDYLIASALLHDVGKLMEIEVDEDGTAHKSENGKLLRHAFTGVAMAMRHGIPDEVTHVIAVHSREGEASKRSVIAGIVQHADQVNEYLSKAAN